jgi:hypothetical protein
MNGYNPKRYGKLNKHKAIIKYPLQGGGGMYERKWCKTVAKLEKKAISISTYKWVPNEP